MPETTDDGKLGGFNAHESCCSVLAYEEGGCKVYLPTEHDGWICLSGDKYSSNHHYTGKLADLLFAWNKAADERVSCALELKGGGIRVSGVVGQLQGGALIVDQLLSGLPVEFLPVLVHKSISTVSIRELRKQRINFRGERLLIRLINCPGRLSDVRW